MNSFKADKWVRILTWLFALGWFAYFSYKNEVPVDTGDGLAHFYISQFSWQDPFYFFEHWGKPVFILLSSPFAQFGFEGMIIFNLLVFSITILIGFKLLDNLGVSGWLQSILPLFLITAKDYCLTVMGGLTEPLFNLALVATAFLLVRRKYMWMAILVSFMPFMRSEGQLPVLLVFLIFVLHKEWKYIPFLFVGFIIYSIAGSFAHHDVLWYFTKSPYSMENAIYGKGEWSHYFTSYRNYLGNPGLYMTILGVIGAVGLLLKKKISALEFDVSILAYGTFVGVVLSHSYFWATGQNGSIGLTRIATQGMPLFLIVQMTHWTRYINAKELNRQWIYGIFIIPLVWSLMTKPNFPILANPIENQLQAASKFIKETCPDEINIYCHFPYFAYLMEQNPLDNKSKVIYTGFQSLEDDLKKKIPLGSIIVWDSHFGPVEAGRSFFDMKNTAGLVIVREFLFEGTENDPKGVVLFQHVPEGVSANQKKVKISKRDNIILDLSSDSEFTNLFEDEMSSHVADELTFSVSSNKGSILVFDSEEMGYTSFDLSEDEKELRFALPKSGKGKLYLWNPNKMSGKAAIKNIEFRSTEYPKVWKP